MMQTLKRLLAMVLCMALLTGNLPATAFAVEIPEEETHATEPETTVSIETTPETVPVETEITPDRNPVETEPETLPEETEPEETVAAVPFTSDVAIVNESRAAAESGTCGDNITWTLKDGALTLSGSGEMYNYGNKSGPWYWKRDKITSVTIENGITSIGESTFFDFEVLTAISISASVTSIGKDAFYGSNLTSVEILGNEVKISESAFESCYSLQSVTVSGSISSIGPYAFMNCSALKKFDFKKGLTSIGMDAFRNCRMTELVLPEGLQTIAVRAFYQCSKVESVVIPTSVTSIGSSAFESCSSLKTVYYAGTEEQWNEIEIASESGLEDKTICYNYRTLVASGTCGAEEDNVT